MKKDIPVSKLSEKPTEDSPSRLAYSITSEFIECPVRNGILPPEGIRMARIVDRHLINFFPDCKELIIRKFKETQKIC